jgi:homoserine kinase type II
MPQEAELPPLQTLCGLYRLGGLQAADPVTAGTTAQVCRVTAASGASVLFRSLSGPDQGQREWAIFRHLASRGFPHTPDILTTPDGSPMAEAGGVWYQAQRYCPGRMPDPAQPGVVPAVAALAVRLTHALSDCPGEGWEDRFDLASVWSAHRAHWPRLALPMSQEAADRAVAELASLPVQEKQVIHGDLGPWNLLLQDSGELLVIDFGAARLGDPYFDLATALAGLVNHAPAELRRQVAGKFLAQCRRLTPLDESRLKTQLRLWAWRGLVQCVQAAERGGSLWPQMARRYHHALCWAEEEL